MGISMDSFALNITFDLKQKERLLLHCFLLTLMQNISSSSQIVRIMVSDFFSTNVQVTHAFLE